MHTYRGQRKMSGVLLYYTLLYFQKPWWLPKPGAMVAVSCLPVFFSVPKTWDTETHTVTVCIVARGCRHLNSGPHACMENVHGHGTISPAPAGRFAVLVTTFWRSPGQNAFHHISFWICFSSSLKVKTRSLIGFKLNLLVLGKKILHR